MLDIGVRGMLNVLDSCRKQDVGRLVVASSSETYQQPPVVPTPEDVPLSSPTSSIDDIRMAAAS